MAVKETAENCRKSKRPFSVAGVLKSLGVSLSGYKSFLKWKLPEQKKKKAEVQQQITEIHKDSRQIFGAPKIAKELKKKGYGTSERTVSAYRNGIKDPLNARHIPSLLLCNFSLRSSMQAEIIA